MTKLGNILMEYLPIYSAKVVGKGASGGANIPLLQRRFAGICSALDVRSFDMSCSLVSDKEIRKLNNKYRKIDAVTDILSFPYEPLVPGEKPREIEGIRDLGDIYMAIPYIARQCQEEGLLLDDRLAVLAAHGVCHLLGYVHETDEQFAQMDEKEKLALKSIAHLTWLPSDDVMTAEEKIESEQSMADMKAKETKVQDQRAIANTIGMPGIAKEKRKTYTPSAVGGGGAKKTKKGGGPVLPAWMGRKGFVTSSY